MYEDLVKRLRNLSDTDNIAEFDEAADAIEELSETIPHNCFCCVGCEIEPKDGQGCEAGFLLSANRAKQYIEQLSKPRWIPVTERLPEPKFAREWYLVALESGCVKTLAFEKEDCTDNLFHHGWHDTASPVTHWMPLPEPPKEG